MKKLNLVMLFIAIIFSCQLNSQTLEETYEYLENNFSTLLNKDSRVYGYIKYSARVINSNLGEFEITEYNYEEDGDLEYKTKYQFFISNISIISVSKNNYKLLFHFINDRDNVTEICEGHITHTYGYILTVDAKYNESLKRIKKAFLHAKKLLEDNDPFK